MSKLQEVFSKVLSRAPSRHSARKTLRDAAAVSLQPHVNCHPSSPLPTSLFLSSCFTLQSSRDLHLSPVMHSRSVRSRNSESANEERQPGAPPILLVSNMLLTGNPYKFLCPAYLVGVIVPLAFEKQQRLVATRSRENPMRGRHPRTGSAACVKLRLPAGAADRGDDGNAYSGAEATSASETVRNSINHTTVAIYFEPAQLTIFCL